MNKAFNISKILIPVDFSETSNIAIEHAMKLCSKFDASLHLLHILPYTYSDILPNISATDTYTSDNSKIKEKAIEELKKVGQQCNENFGINYNIEVREGSISKEIIKTAQEVHADIIVMGTHGTSGFEEFFLGSNAYRVVTASNIPVLTVQSHSTNLDCNHIILPIDSSKHTRDKVSQAATLAKVFNSTIHILGLITKEHEDEKAIFDLKIKQVEEYLDDQGVSYVQKVIHGDDIAEMIHKYAEEVKADLVVIMTEQEAATGLFMGPYAQRIVNHSKTPVLSITPIELIEGFSQSDLGGGYRPFYI